MGMRDLLVFYKAMLAKQFWRLLTNKQSLMFKTLKNKYFSNADLMEAKINPNACYTWRSIMSARDVILKGARKVVGYGFAVDIWHDTWVPSLPEFKVLPRQNHDVDLPGVVSELLENSTWNTELLNETFSE
uniref:Uncharacterized protein n=1 Tax=Chenopodium quinoa TaxID=63459 RepID=A0A803M2K7_CHEQI